MSRKYLWRVTAYYSKQFHPLPEPITEWTTSRHYQSKQAAEQRARLLREGRSGIGGYGPNGEMEYLPGIEKADRVVVERSAPVDGWTEVPS